MPNFPDDVLLALGLAVVTPLEAGERVMQWTDQENP